MDLHNLPYLYILHIYIFIYSYFSTVGLVISTYSDLKKKKSGKDVNTVNSRKLLRDEENLNIIALEKSCFDKSFCELKKVRFSFFSLEFIYI